MITAPSVTVRRSRGAQGAPLHRPHLAAARRRRSRGVGRGRGLRRTHGLDTRRDREMLERRSALLHLAPHGGGGLHVDETARPLERVEHARGVVGESVDDERILARANRRQIRFLRHRLAQRRDDRRPVRRPRLDLIQRREVLVRGVDGRTADHRRRELRAQRVALGAHLGELAVHAPQLDPAPRQ